MGGGSCFVQPIVLLECGNGGLCISSCDAIRRSAIVARFVQRRLDALYYLFVSVFHEHSLRFSFSPSRFFLLGKFLFIGCKFFFPTGLHFVSGDY